MSKAGYAGWDSDWQVVRPPETFEVEAKKPQPVLYQADGTALIRRPAGFDTRSDRS